MNTPHRSHLKLQWNHNAVRGEEGRGKRGGEGRGGEGGRGGERRGGEGRGGREEAQGKACRRDGG